MHSGAMSTDDNDAYGDLDKSNLKFIYEQFLSGGGLRNYCRILKEAKHSSHWQNPMMCSSEEKRNRGNEIRGTGYCEG